MFEYQNILENVPIFFGKVWEAKGDVHAYGLFNGIRVYSHRNNTIVASLNNAYMCDLLLIPGQEYCFAWIDHVMTDEEVEDYVNNFPNKSNGLIDWIIRNSNKEKTVPTEEKTEKKDVPMMEPDSIYRICYNELKSNLFTNGKYTVRYSPNGRRMLITPNKYGRTECRNGVITVPGMEKRRPFTTMEKVRFTRNDSGFSLVFA